jgi:hypothetical protein
VLVVTEELDLVAHPHQEPPAHVPAVAEVEAAEVHMSDQSAVRRDGGAIESATSWSVNGSTAEGRKMLRDFSKLMLHTYNVEADNLT